MSNFKWEELLERIENRRIIPVIGSGLYFIKKTEYREILLYDYLADILAEDSGITLPEDSSHRFARAVLAYLKKNKYQYLKLSNFLFELIEHERITTYNPLMQLARIKPFGLFINTTYDNFLFSALRSVRDHPIIELTYTLKEKKLKKLEDQALFDDLEYSNLTLIYYIYGKLKQNADPALTEKDILETIVEFQKDIQVNPNNIFFQELERKSPLFLGCGFEDWLFRFFIRAVSNEPYCYPKDPYTCKFIFEAFQNQQEVKYQEFIKFIGDYQIEIFYSSNCRKFLDILLKKLQKDYPDTIIPENDFPSNVFISFEGTDRPSANNLVDNLKSDGINVWLDDRKFQPGDDIDRTIIRAIEKCPVFIPLISHNAKTLHTKDGKEKYHYQEWCWALNYNMRYDTIQKIIIPVKIDDTGWMYEKFTNIYFLNIPDGKRTAGYDKLLKKLQEILNFNKL